MGQYSLFDSAKSSLYPTTYHNTPLPDTMRTATLVEKIGEDRSWTNDQILGDVGLLEKNRLYSILEVLPLVRDLLKQAIDETGHDDKKKKKKDKKTNKEKKKKKNSGYDELTDTIDMSPEVMKDTLSDDPETIRNTIRNGSIDVGKLDPLLVPSSPPTRRKKSVSFSPQEGLIPPSLLTCHDESTSSSSDDDTLKKGSFAPHSIKTSV